MKLPIWKNLLLLTAFIMLPISAQAEDCDPKQPSFTVDGVEKWSPKTAAEIFEQLPKQLLKNKNIRPPGLEVISIKQLIESHGGTGSLTLTTCNGNSFNVEMKNLSDSPKSTQYYLLLARKHFFKLIESTNSQPVLKQIKTLQLNTQ